jgi:hypothetical protein
MSDTITKNVLYFSDSYTNPTEAWPTGKWKLHYHPKYSEPEMYIEITIQKKARPFFVSERNVWFGFPEKTVEFNSEAMTKRG